jgi:hypothetical protein
MITILPATRDHAHALIARIRPADAAEINALGYADPLDGLIECLDMAVSAFTGFIDGELAAIAGFAVPEMLGRRAMPWLVTTDTVDRHPLAFARASRRILDALRKDHELLENYVDARHTVCVRWLRWLGCTLEPAQPLAPHGLMFHRFTIKGSA